MHRRIGVLFTMVFILALSGSTASSRIERGWTGLAAPGPFVTPLDLHPLGPDWSENTRAIATAMPRVVRQGQVTAPDARRVEVPVVVTPSQPAEEVPDPADGKAGTGFFIGDDGTLLTAAHVTSGCGRIQIISRWVTRTWVSLVATDEAHDIAVLKAPGLRSPAVVHVASAAPRGGRLLVLGYPATANLTIASETWAVMENEKFPPEIGPLTNPRELLWMSAPEVTHGYSGGPVFDPRLGAVVGLVKGAVDGGYLRLIRDMPTTGVAIGPGIGRISDIMRREVPYGAVSLVSSPGEAGVDTLRHATVHVLCWH